MKSEMTCRMVYYELHKLKFSYRTDVIKLVLGGQSQNKDTRPIALDFPRDSCNRGRRTGQVERRLKWEVSERLVRDAVSAWHWNRSCNAKDRVHLAIAIF